jgi:hypothetical protein
MLQIGWRVAGKRRRTRQKVWRPPLVPFNKLPLCPFCGTEMGMKRPGVEACIVCVADWPEAEIVREKRIKAERSLRDRLHGT